MNQYDIIINQSSDLIQISFIFTQCPSSVPDHPTGETSHAANVSSRLLWTVTLGEKLSVPTLECGISGSLSIYGFYYIKVISIANLLGFLSLKAVEFHQMLFLHVLGQPCDLSER